ncbi:lysophosphatidylcholine acyltransferase 2-like isoform X2 [Mizuhopecten yessoensis]|uniref:Sulfhydryl light chain n=1 Tax=Mizuhopecten yessoensis TaxID=6573 RepID=A0A210PE32_MIZYE|nr:lysophosphatidylcholine acyltransferase 2-like isoform X2 [Mizuhopecten yessoensis]OWF34743.1 Lysophosphatidylcholine acyltransferase 1 [Mizuhopecten yessoensis]
MKRNVGIPRQTSLATPVVPNPFVHQIDLTNVDKIRIALMSIFVVPLRLIFCAIFLLSGFVLATIALAFRTPEEKQKPLCGWRNIFRPLVVLMCRGLFLAGGFHWVTIKGKRVCAAEAPILTLVPHSTYFDALPVVALELTTIVAKSQAEKVPFFGTLMAFTQPVYVNREDPNSRQNTIKEINRRAKSGGQWPQIIIFPEGTCTNRKAVINFKSGAFYPCMPVQPVCIRYPNKMDTYTWTWEGPGAFTCFWLTLCNFHNAMEIEFLPVISPNEEEKDNVKLFAERVRRTMAECLGVPTTDHSFDDCRLMKQAGKLKLPLSTGLVEFSKLHNKLGVKLQDLQSMLERYSSIAQSNTGVITLDQFAKYLHLPKSEALEQVFALYDRNSSGVIDFREYVIGLSLVSSPVNTEETIKLAFQLFDKEDKGYISRDDLTMILHNAFGMEDVDRLFEQVDTKNDEKITYDEFKAFAELNPEYAKLFTTYREAKVAPGNGHAAHVKSE